MNVADYSEDFQHVVLFYQEVAHGKTEILILDRVSKVHFSTHPVFGLFGLYLKSIATKYTGVTLLAILGSSNCLSSSPVRSWNNSLTRSFLIYGFVSSSRNFPAHSSVTRTQVDGKVSGLCDGCKRKCSFKYFLLCKTCRSFQPDNAGVLDRLRVADVFLHLARHWSAENRHRAKRKTITYVNLKSSGMHGNTGDKLSSQKPAKTVTPAFSFHCAITSSLEIKRDLSTSS